MSEQNLNGTIEALREAVAAVDEKVENVRAKVDLISIQLVDLTVRVSMHGEQLKDYKDHGEHIARLETYVTVIWALIAIILAAIAGVVFKSLLP